MIVRPLSSSAPPSVAAALFVHRGAVGAHVGMIHSDDTGTVRVLHQAWHHDSRNDTLAAYEAEPGQVPLFWVPPGLDDDEQEVLRAQVALAARHLPPDGLRYAFRDDGASVGPDGEIQLGTSDGLSCATFVTLLFKAARVPFVDKESWATRTSAREAEDRAAQEKLIKYLAASRDEDDRKQAKLLVAEVGTPRIRAEEVAAASGSPQRPVEFTTAEALGRELLAEMNNLAPPSAHASSSG